MAKLKQIKSVEDLTPDPANINKGTERGKHILDWSLTELGAGRSILADADGIVIAGNKTLQAATGHQLPVRVVETDGNELVVVQRRDLRLRGRGKEREKARQMAAADNRASEVGYSVDVARLLEHWQGDADLSALYREDEIDELLESLMPKDAEDAEGDEDLPDDAIGGMASTFALKNDAVFASSNEYGIPDLLPELLAECPPDLTVWAGQKSEPAKHYLAIYQNIGTVGLQKENALLAFYTSDSKFENVWYQTAETVEKLLAQRWKAVVTPNYSLWSHQPRLIQMWQVFRSRWIGRYLQGVGINVIPDIDWIDERSFEFNLLGIPRNPPCVSIQNQTGLKDATEEVQRADGIEQIVALLEPKQLLVYGANEDWRERITEIVAGRCQVIHVEQLSRRLRRAFKEVKQ